MFNISSLWRNTAKNKIKFQLDFSSDNSAEAMMVANESEFTKFGITNFQIKATAKLTAPFANVRESPSIVIDTKILIGAEDLVFFTDDNNRFLAFRGSDNSAIRLTIELYHGRMPLSLLRTASGDGMSAMFYLTGKPKKPLTLDGVITIDTE